MNSRVLQRLLAATALIAATGAQAQAGLERPLDERWSVVLDMKKVWARTQANGILPAFGGAPARATIRLDPLITALSVSRRF